jgi:hypothetical protein
MEQPQQVPGWLLRQSIHVFEFGSALNSESPDGEPLWQLAAPHLDSQRHLPPRAETPEGLPRSFGPLVSALSLLNGAGDDSRPTLLGYRNSLPDSITSFLSHDVLSLILEDAGDEFRSAQWQDSLQQHEESIARTLTERLHLVPRQQVWVDGQLLVEAFLAWSEAAHTVGTDAWLDVAERSHPPRIWDTKYGRVAMGTRDRDVYQGQYAFIFDPGGDDHYALTYDFDRPSRVIIDLAGDDTYHAESDAALAAGVWGVQILYDRRGQDIYRARSFDLGAGFYGWGVLIDAAGHDVYEGDTFVMGAGGFGAGWLIDSAGNDTYNAALYGEGFGFVAGSGVLYDHTGNDHYHAGGLYKDVLRYTDRYLSLSQGFAMGVRPFLSGGVGLLLDRRGNDDYNCDIFGQGASYWWGLGGLWDGSGNDRYLAFQYAQGSATHMTVGVLVDVAGDDIYFSKGVSQGCGHDLAPGMLWDLGGNDTYTAFDLSQGAGSANGLGVLFDAGGDDRYYVKSALNTQGYGNPRREYGSIGLFLDGGGTDRYDGPGADSSWWQGPSLWGVGIDYAEPAVGDDE